MFLSCSTTPRSFVRHGRQPAVRTRVVCLRHNEPKRFMFTLASSLYSHFARVSTLPYEMLSVIFLEWAVSIVLLVNNVNSLPASQLDASGQPVVDFGYSKYQGIKLDSGVNQYLGMRYASPPVRNLRFRAPAEPLTTTSLQNATAVSGYFLHLMVTR